MISRKLGASGKWEIEASNALGRRRGQNFTELVLELCASKLAVRLRALGSLSSSFLTKRLGRLQSGVGEYDAPQKANGGKITTREREDLGGGGAANGRRVRGRTTWRRVE